MDKNVIINQVPTRFLVFGPDFENIEHAKAAIIVIPGNPGAIEYYREFMGSLHQIMQADFPVPNIPVWGISHAGHQIDGIEYPFPSLEENQNLYDLDGQVEHKLGFLSEFVPKDLPLLLIGHSIGCHITLKVLDQLESSSSRIVKCFLLFPTIERMRDTPNGQFIGKLLPYQTLISPFLWTMFKLPNSFKEFLVKLYFSCTGISTPDCVKKAATQLMNQQVFENVKTMCMDELAKVFLLNEECIQRHLKKLFFYFGKTDDWCPLHYATDMTTKYPELQHQICPFSISHAFVIESSSLMASILAPMISDVIKEL